MYFGLREVDQDTIMMVIDTEGLSSINSDNDSEESRLIFDNLMATMTFLISDQVILNTKGELNNSLANILGVASFAINELK